MQNKEFVETIKAQCVTVAGSDIAYNSLTDGQKSKGEYQFLKKSLTDTKHGIHQGIYLITPSGKLIKQLNWGWPTPDTDKMNAQLIEAIASYNSMSKSDRLGSSAMADSERSLPKEKFIITPKSWLQLRNTSRSYAFSEMDLFDIRNPVYNKIDKLWFTETEKLKLLPPQLTIGGRGSVDKLLVHRLLSHSHLITTSAAWWLEHIKKGDLTMEVKAVKGEKIQIHYHGDFLQNADYKWNQSSYKGTLLGKAIWNTRAKKFEKFTWVALGDYTIQNLRSNMHRGTTKTVRIASKLELDPKFPAEADLTPASWDEYPKEIRSQISK